MGYQKSDEHRQNAEVARAKALQIIGCPHCGATTNLTNHKKHLAVCLYADDNIKLCTGCDERIFTPGNKFCTRSCAATFNNKQKAPKSEETKEKIRQSLKGRKGHGKNAHHLRHSGKKAGITLEDRKCSSCDTTFSIEPWRSKRFCSKECRFKSRNESGLKWGKCLAIKYFCNAMQKEVTLQSTWELKVAERLDASEIVWIRPEPIKWFDSTGKSHWYFPDFYLPDHDLYLDPKNRRVMERDTEKLHECSKQINLIAGELTMLMEKISEIYC